MFYDFELLCHHWNLVKIFVEIVIVKIFVEIVKTIVFDVVMDSTPSNIPNAT